MSSDNNDSFGGMFDFNGDGKTTFDEEMLAYHIFEESMKDSGGTGCGYRPIRRSAPQPKPYVPASPVVPPKASTFEPLTRENYHQRRGSLWLSIIVSVLIGLVLSIIPIVIIWAPIASYEPNPYYNDSYSSLIVFLIFLTIGLGILKAIWEAFFASIRQDFEDLRRLKQNYKKLLSEDDLPANCEEDNGQPAAGEGK